MVDEVEQNISKIEKPEEEGEGRIIHVAGPVVEADNLTGVEMYEVVEVGEEGLIGEVIELDEDVATIQVYEETGGVKPGEPVRRTGEPLSLELGPGLIEQIYDGIQRPLQSIVEEAGDFIRRGIDVSPLDEEKEWNFEPKAEKGDEVEHGDILGVVDETPTVDHKVMVPPDTEGTIKEIVSEGEYTINETVAVLENEEGEEEISMKQRWPVRIGRPIKDKKQPGELLVTGQRVLDTFFPLAKGGTAAIPGGFGTGKCVTGDTPILFADGSKEPIEEIYEKYKEKGKKKVDGKEELIELDEPLEILSMDDGKISEKDATCLYKGKTDSTIEIKTRSGREVELTPVHKLFVLTPEMDIVQKPARDIEQEDTLLVPRRLPFGDKTEKQKLTAVDLLPDKRVHGEDFEEVIQAIDELEEKLGSRKELAERLGISEDVLTEYALGRNRPKVKVAKEIFEQNELYHEIREVKAERRSTSIKIPEKIDEDFAELLGLLLGDGSLKPTSIHFYNNDEELLSRVEELFLELFDVKAEREYARTVDSVKVNCKSLRDLLVSLGFPEEGKSRNCSIPSKVFKSGEKAIAAFVRGYYLADGSFSKYEIEIDTSSEEMASDLTYALTMIAVPPRLSSRETQANKSYRLRVSGEELENFYEKTSVDHPKYEKIKKYLEKDSDHFRGINSVNVSP
ncbi:MAG: LAGLIDADG family homing endonuclease, partial [Candidatus Thermoplasmatota archaeon]